MIIKTSAVISGTTRVKRRGKVLTFYEYDMKEYRKKLFFIF